MPSKKSETSFEESLTQLEKVATDIERGDLSLEQAIAEFEKGMKLSKECSEKLDLAEKRIHILVQGKEDSLVEEKFEQED